MRLGRGITTDRPGLGTLRLRAVPVTVDLRATGVLGVVGDRARVDELTRWLIVQLATRRSPEDLSLVILCTDGGTHLSWTRWLPHLDVGDDGDAPCRVGTTPETREARCEWSNYWLTLIALFGAARGW